MDRDQKLEGLTPPAEAVSPEAPLAPVEAHEPSPAVQSPDPTATVLEIAKALDVCRSGKAKLFARLEPDGGPWIDVGSEEFRNRLLGKTYETCGSIPSPTAIQSAISTLKARGYAMPVKPIARRVYGKDDRLWVCLGPESKQLIEITPDGWQPVADAPVLFLPPSNAATLPMPLPGGSVNLLRELLPPMRDADWHAIVGFIIATYLPEGPFPILAVSGGKGSGKSVACELIRNTTDPLVETDSRMDLPDRADALWTSGATQHVLSFENVTKLTGTMMDNLCKVSTGAASQARTHFEQGTTHTNRLRNPIIINGINLPIEREDLASRTIFIELEPMKEDFLQRPEAAIRREFRDRMPQLLGAIFDAVVMALRHYRGTTVQSGHRLLDAANFVTAAEPALGLPDGAIVSAWNQSQCDRKDEMAGIDPVGSVLDRIVPKSGAWSGTASELLAAALALERGKRSSALPRDFPRSASGIGDYLKRKSEVLARAGFRCGKSRTGTCRTISIDRCASDATMSRTIVIRPVGKMTTVTGSATLSDPGRVPEATTPEKPEPNALRTASPPALNAATAVETTGASPKRRGRPKKVVTPVTPVTPGVVGELDEQPGGQEPGQPIGIGGISEAA
jgi:hypothetical protein